MIRIRVPSLARAARATSRSCSTHYLATAARELGVEPKTLTARGAQPPRRLRLAGQRAPARERGAPPDGDRAGARDPRRGHSRRISAAKARDARRADDWCRELEAWAARHLAGGGPPLLDVATERFERTLARAALERVQGRRQEAAKLIGWGRNTLTRKLRELGLE